MSFTQDELDAFNTILEQKLAIHRHELELSLDQRMSALKHTLEQSLAMQRDLLHKLPLSMDEQQNGASEQVSQHLEPYQTHGIEAVEQGKTEIAEIQAEIAWDDLMEVIDTVVEKRLSTLETSLQAIIKNAELSILTQMHNLQNDLLDTRSHTDPLTLNPAPGRDDVFSGIEQLEHIVEALQVTMAANHAILSTRLYQHQHQHFEHAHPTPPSHQNDVQNEFEG